MSERIPIIYNTLNDVFNDPDLYPDMIVQTLGRNSITDGYGAKYKVISKDEALSNTKAISSPNGDMHLEIIPDASTKAIEEIEKVDTDISNLIDTVATLSSKIDELTSAIENLSPTPEPEPTPDPTPVDPDDPTPEPNYHVITDTNLDLEGTEIRNNETSDPVVTMTNSDVSFDSVDIIANDDSSAVALVKIISSTFESEYNMFATNAPNTSGIYLEDSSVTLDNASISIHGENAEYGIKCGNNDEVEYCANDIDITGSTITYSGDNSPIQIVGETQLDIENTSISNSSSNPTISVDLDDHRADDVEISVTNSVFTSAKALYIHNAGKTIVDKDDEEPEDSSAVISFTATDFGFLPDTNVIELDNSIANIELDACEDIRGIIKVSNESELELTLNNTNMYGYVDCDRESSVDLTLSGSIIVLTRDMDVNLIIVDDDDESFIYLNGHTLTEDGEVLTPENSEYVKEGYPDDTPIEPDPVDPDEPDKPEESPHTISEDDERTGETFESDDEEVYNVLLVNACDVVLNDCGIINNEGSDEESAIRVFNGSLELNSCTVDASNTTTSGIIVDGSELNASDSNINIFGAGPGISAINTVKTDEDSDDVTVNISNTNIRYINTVDPVFKIETATTLDIDECNIDNSESLEPIFHVVENTNTEGDIEINVLSTEFNGHSLVQFTGIRPEEDCSCVFTMSDSTFGYSAEEDTIIRATSSVATVVLENCDSIIGNVVSANASELSLELTDTILHATLTKDETSELNITLNSGSSIMLTGDSEIDRLFGEEDSDSCVYLCGHTLIVGGGIAESSEDGLVRDYPEEEDPDKPDEPEEPETPDEPDPEEPDEPIIPPVDLDEEDNNDDPSSTDDNSDSENTESEEGENDGTEDTKPESDEAETGEEPEKPEETDDKEDEESESGEEIPEEGSSEETDESDVNNGTDDGTETAGTESESDEK